MGGKDYSMYAIIYVHNCVATHVMIYGLIVDTYRDINRTITEMLRKYVEHYILFYVAEVDFRGRRWVDNLCGILK